MKKYRIHTWIMMFIAGAVSAQSPQFERGENRLHVDLGNGAELTFAMEGEWLLGLQTATIDGVTLSADDTVQRPVIAQDHGAVRHIIQSYRLTDVSTEDGRVVLTLGAVATRDPAHLQQVFVMQGSTDLLEREGMTPELEALRQAAGEANDALDALVLESPSDRLARTHRELTEARERMNAVPEHQVDTHHYIQAVQNLQRRERQFRNLRNRTLNDMQEKNHPDVARLRASVSAWEQARMEAAGQHLEIHRDYYKFPIWRQPNEVNTLDAVRARAAEAEADGVPAGTVRWVLSPEGHTVGGWPWRGWRQHFELDLAEEMRNNHLAVLGTWEMGGDAVGNTLYALRYRGLGGLVQSFSADDAGGASEAFSTTEIIPGAAGGAPLVSPVVAGEGIDGDRTHALQHRVGAWIAQPGRGTGAPFFDFYAGADAMFAAVPVRQGNLRAVTEVMPGDRHISQTDLEYFALSTQHTTIPMQYLVLTPGEGGPFSVAEQRTRYQEMDQHVRKVVSEELGFVQYDVLPGIHYMFDHNFRGNMAQVAAKMDELAELGVRRIETHHHGWQNGRERNPGQEHIGGGVCDIYDYRPLAQVEESWRDATKAAARHGIPHYVWLTGMCRIGGPLFEHIGSDIERWAFPEPNPTSIFRDSTGYAGNVNFNIHNTVTRERLLERLREAREEFGYQGFWADSFQNLFMSQLDWAQGTGDSLQRSWWEVIAQWSREGVSWTSESHAFPGQSCSIEVQGGWDNDNLFLTNQVNRAFRANTFPNSGQPEADVLAFGFMANRGWAAPDMRAPHVPTQVVPSFQRLSNEYMAALPMMRRSVQLPDDQGVVWLGYEGDGEGVWFSKTPAGVPEGVTATPILGGDAVAETEAIHTYRVQAEDLLAAFGIRRPPHADERIGTEWEAPEYYWPEWARP